MVIRYWCGIELKGFLFDTGVMHHTLDEEPPHKLELLADYEFGTGDYSAPLRQIVGQDDSKSYDLVPDELLWPYAATDAECCYRLCEVYYVRLQEKPHLWNLYCEESVPLTWVLYRAEWHGGLIDDEVVKRLLGEYKMRQGELLAQMNIRVPTKIDDRGNVIPFNPLSTQQVKEAFVALGYGKWIEDKYKSTGFDTSKEKLGTLYEEHEEPLAKWILEYRTNTKYISTYLEPVLSDMDYDGRVRYSWFPLTTSARLSCRFFHQIPRIDKKRRKEGKDNLRDAFIVPKGSSYVYADYSQVELKVLAVLANDEYMLKLYDEGGDIHKATTECMLEGYGPANDHNRQEVGKPVNFGLAYGSKGNQVVKTCTWQDFDGKEHPMTWEIFNVGMENFKAQFKGLSAYLEDTPELARSNQGILRTPFGRERRLGARLNEGNKGRREAAEREIVNFSIQSPAGGITLRTLIIMDNLIEGWIAEGSIKRGDVALINTVHDSVAYEVKDELVEWFTGVLQTVAERPIPELNNYKFDVKVGVGRNWTIAENGEL
jgi:DNA polymerase-1